MKSAYSPRRTVANTYLVRQRDRRRRRELVLVVLALLPLGLGLLIYTWIHLETLGTGYRINELERQLHDLTRTERQLRLEAGYRGRPERIERYAIETLGMQEQSLEQTIYFEEVR